MARDEGVALVSAIIQFVLTSEKWFVTDCGVCKRLGAYDSQFIPDLVMSHNDETSFFFAGEAMCIYEGCIASIAFLGKVRRCSGNSCCPVPQLLAK